VFLQQEIHRRSLIEQPWTLLTITGPPGSGKTETARYLLSQLSRDPRALIYVPSSSPGALTRFKSVLTSDSPVQFFESVVETMVAESIEVPSSLWPISSWRTPLKQVLLESLVEQRQRLFLVVDDYHMHQDVGDALVALRQTARAWGVHIILISRPQVLSLRDETRYDLICQLWTKEDAGEILKEWVKPEQAATMANALESGWLSRQTEFSLYLLQVIAQYADDIGTAPTILLRRAIIEHLSSVPDVGASSGRLSPEALLSRIKGLLQSWTPYEQILAEFERRVETDMVHLFGGLSWFSKYQDEERDSFLDAERIVRWSSGMVETSEHAQTLMQAAAEANIFECSTGVAGWKDTLVADGCAALYLAREFRTKDVEDATIAAHVARLESKNSLDILNLVLDPSLILQLVQICTRSAVSTAGAIDQLITRDFIERLSEVPTATMELNDNLLRLGAKASDEEVKQLAKTVSRMCEIVEEVSADCKRRIEKGDPTARVCLVVHAMQYGPTEAYFENVLETAPDHMGPFALDAAALVWGRDGLGRLLEFISRLSGEKVLSEILGRGWQKWCGRLTAEEQLSAAQVIIQHVQNGVLGGVLANALIDRLLRTFFVCVPRAQWDEYGPGFGRLEEVFASGDSSTRRREVPSVLQWCMFRKSPDAVQRNSEWIVDEDRGLAIQVHPNAPATFDYVFGCIRELGEECALPNSKDLLLVESAPVGSWELIRDNLPSRFTYEREIYRGQLAVAGHRDGRFVKRHVNVQTELKDKFYWRPVYRLGGQVVR
jgi:hypothetical protein